MPATEIIQRLPSKPMPPPSVIEGPDGYSDDDSADDSYDDFEDYSDDSSDESDDEPLFEELD